MCFGHLEFLCEVVYTLFFMYLNFTDKLNTHQVPYNTNDQNYCELTKSRLKSSRSASSKAVCSLFSLLIDISENKNVKLSFYMYIGSGCKDRQQRDGKFWVEITKLTVLTHLHHFNTTHFPMFTCHMCGSHFTSFLILLTLCIPQMHSRLHKFIPHSLL